MENDEEWNAFLQDHPIFSLPKSVSGPDGRGNFSLELSLNTLPSFTEFSPNNDVPTPSGRRQTMVIKDADLLVAAGNEIRIASLGRKDSPKSYKVCMSVVDIMHKTEMRNYIRYYILQMLLLKSTPLR